MLINGYEIEFDNTDVEQNERFENAILNMQEKDKNIQEKIKQLDGDIHSRSKSLRMQCEIVFEFFDEIFGEGTHKNIFKNKVSLKLCIDTVEEFIAEIVAKDKEYSRMLENKTKKYSSNRAKRK